MLTENLQAAGITTAPSYTVRCPLLGKVRRIVVNFPGSDSASMAKSCLTANQSIITISGLPPLPFPKLQAVFFVRQLFLYLCRNNTSIALSVPEQNNTKTKQENTFYFSPDHLI